MKQEKKFEHLAQIIVVEVSDLSSSSNDLSVDSASSLASPVSGPGVDGSVDLAVEFAHVVGVEDLDVFSFGFESVFSVAAIIGLRSLHLVEDLGHSLLVSGEVVFVSVVGIEDSLKII